MAKKYDAVIIGAGIGGLSVGALLAKAGKKVLVLEKDNHIGGRAFSVTYRGHVTDNGAHGPVVTGHLEEVFSKVGKPFPELSCYDGTEVWHDGKWKKLGELFSRQELRKVINDDILPLSFEEIAKLDDVQLMDWLDQKTNDDGLKYFFHNFGWLMAVGGHDKRTISAGELLFYLKEHFTRGGGFRNMGGTLKKGLISLMTPLSEVIKEKGSEVRFNTRVSNIVVKDGKVRGVEVEKGERIIPIHVLDTEFIEAPLVVNTLPIWSLFSVISPEELPGWYVEWVRSISEKLSYCLGIRYSLDKPIFDEKVLRWWDKSPTGGEMAPTGITPLPGEGEAVGEYAVDVFHQAAWDDMPPNFLSGHMIVGHEARKLLRLLEEDVKVLFPDIEKHCREKHYWAGIYGIAESPTTVGMYRPSMVVPGIKDLYLVSESVRETRITGMASVARCALLCVDTILKGAK